MKIMITGSTSGLGKALVKQFTHKSNMLYLWGRDEEALRVLKSEIESSVHCELIRVDLSDIKAVQGALKTMPKDMDIVFNCAGTVNTGYIYDQTVDEDIQKNNVNAISPMIITRFFLNHFVEREKGTLINICSTASFAPHPFMSMYGASKSFLKTYTINASLEVKTYKHIVCKAVCPGPMDTKMISEIKKELTRKERMFLMDPNSVAKKIVKNLARRTPLEIIGFENKCLYFLNKFLPNNIMNSLFYKYLKEDR